MGLANLASRLAEVLHGAFVGTIELTCQAGDIQRWAIEETLKSGRVLEPRKAPRETDRYAAEIEHLLRQGDAGFTGRLVLHCNDGAVIRIVPHWVIEEGPGGTLLSEQRLRARA